jgi:hypothetical protein
MQKHRFALVAVLPALLAACQSSQSGITMEPESAVLARDMHPSVKSAFEADYIEVIVKGTSAEALARACPVDVRVIPSYRASLAAVLRSNDIEFGRGSSRREVSQKIAEHRKERNCRSLAQRLNTTGGYDNLFLERI